MKRFLLGSLMALALLSNASAQAPLEEELKDFGHALEEHRLELLGVQKTLIELHGRLDPGDRLYLNRALESLNTVCVSLYYQNQLSSVYGDVASFNPQYVRLQVPRLLSQAGFTLGSLEIEEKKVAYLYLQVIDAETLARLQQAQQQLRGIRERIQAHIARLEKQSAGSPDA